MKYRLILSLLVAALATVMISCAGNAEAESESNVEEVTEPAAPAQNASIEENAPSEPAETVTLKTLFEDKESYDGKVVLISGKCVKVNNNIMGMNWVHIQDGSDPDQELDLTITTQDGVPLDAEVTMQGKIVLNKDFGSGYQYDIMMEEGKLIL